MIAGKTVVYTSGTFDMLHANHIKMIEYARSLGDILIVGVNTDELVESYKSQPIIPFDERIALVNRLEVYRSEYRVEIGSVRINNKINIFAFALERVSAAAERKTVFGVPYYREIKAAERIRVGSFKIENDGIIRADVCLGNIAKACLISRGFLSLIER